MEINYEYMYLINLQINDTIIKSLTVARYQLPEKYVYKPEGIIDIDYDSITANNIVPGT